jgi:hypothetical protein
VRGSDPADSDQYLGSIFSQSIKTSWLHLCFYVTGFDLPPLAIVLQISLHCDVLNEACSLL